jgi:hypothetical protein
MGGTKVAGPSSIAPLFCDRGRSPPPLSPHCVAFTVSCPHVTAAAPFVSLWDATRHDGMTALDFYKYFGDNKN